MFHLVVMACLLADPAICAERVLPAPAPLAETECRGTAVARVAAWALTHADLKLGKWRCLPAGDLPALPVQEIAPGVFVHSPKADAISPQNGGDIANLGIVIGDDSVAVIDPGGSRALGEALFAAIRMRTDKPITFAVITHMHPDHSFGAEVFAEAGATIIGHRNLASGIERRAETWAETIPAQVGAPAMLGTKVRLPDRFVERPENLDLGAATLQLTPVAVAHTDNDLTIFHSESGTLFTGDLIFADLLPSLDGSIVGWLRWLGASPYPMPRHIVPGHGPVSTNWATATGPVRSYLTALADQTRAAIKAGEAMSTAADHIGQDQRGTWRGFDEFNERNAIAAFKELEWE